MYVFVSWAYVDKAKQAEEKRATWVSGLAEKDAKGNAGLIEQITTENCLPEYAALWAVNSGEAIAADSLTANLLSVRFVIPSMERVVTYQLAKRMPGSNKLCVGLACRAFLLNTFKGAWTGDLTTPSQAARSIPEKPNKDSVEAKDSEEETKAAKKKKKKKKDNRLIFVGLEGLSKFFEVLAATCAAKKEPLPIDLWRSQMMVELPEDAALRTLVDACAYNQKQKGDQQKYQDLILGWMGSGASAERDSAIALATGFRLGLEVVKGT